MDSYLKGMYNLQPIDFLKLNKDKLAKIYNCSDIDALNYMYPFCEGKWKELCTRILKLNEEELFGEDEYIDGKWKLLNHFGIESDLGDAIVK